MKPKTTKQVLSIRVNPKLIEKLTSEAEKQSLTVSKMICEHLEQWMKIRVIPREVKE